MRGFAVPRVLVVLVLVAGALGACGCATLRLNGCHKVASCGELGAYTCGEDLICATGEGETLHSEPVSGSRNPCHICAHGI